MFDYAINIEEKVFLQGELQPKEEWTIKYPSVPADIQQLSGRKLEFARQLVSDCDYQITIHYHTEITTKLRAMDIAGNIYYIRNIKGDVGRIGDLTLFCTREQT